MSDETLLETLKKASSAIYIVTDEETANHISILFRRAGSEIAALQSDLAAVKAEQDAVFKEAHFLATAIHRKHYHEVTQWKPLDYTAGLISQIDNMAAGLSLDLAAAREEIARARAKLIREWTGMGWDKEVAIANATERYAREIAHAPKGEEG